MHVRPLGLRLQGEVTYRFSDHDETFGEGEAFYVPPGHVPLVAAGTEYLQFSPAEKLNEVARHMTENMQRMQGASAPG